MIIPVGKRDYSYWWRPRSTPISTLEQCDLHLWLKVAELGPGSTAALFYVPKLGPLVLDAVTIFIDYDNKLMELYRFSRQPFNS